jgi:hypothetical protein
LNPPETRFTSVMIHSKFIHSYIHTFIHSEFIYS